MWEGYVFTFIMMGWFLAFGLRRKGLDDILQLGGNIGLTITL